VPRRAQAQVDYVEWQREDVLGGTACGLKGVARSVVQPLGLPQRRFELTEAFEHRGVGGVLPLSLFQVFLSPSRFIILPWASLGR
jgi:hypothetical protein